MLAAVDQVARRHPVDLGRVAVAGLSAGGSMAALLGARYPSRFCAVVMHSGVAPGTAESAATAAAAMRGSRDAHLPAALVPLPPGGWGGASDGTTTDAPPAHPLPPLLILHGDADGVVSVRNAAATAVLWANAAGARATASRTLRRGQRYPMQAMEFKAHGQVVVSVREITGLGHAWSGGAPGLPHSDPAGPDASALAWAFVEKQLGRR